MSTALPVVITPPVYFRQRGSLTRGCATGCRINCFNSAGSGSRNSTGVVHMEFSHASAENYSPLAVFHDIRDNHFFVACKVKAPATAKIHAFHKSQEARATYGGNLSSFSWANFKVELVCIQAFLFSGFSLWNWFWCWIFYFCSFHQWQAWLSCNTGQYIFKDRTNENQVLPPLGYKQRIKNRKLLQENCGIWPI